EGMIDASAPGGFVVPPAALFQIREILVENHTSALEQPAHQSQIAHNGGAFRGADVQIQSSARERGRSDELDQAIAPEPQRWAQGRRKPEHVWPAKPGVETDQPAHR